MEDEIAGALDFMAYVYKTLGFTFELNLSTRPAKFLGDIETWDRAEASLTNALNAFGAPWKIKPEDGAFYGPKIDITVRDALVSADRQTEREREREREKGVHNLAG